MIPKEILKKVKKIELITRHLVNDVFAGKCGIVILFLAVTCPVHSSGAGPKLRNEKDFSSFYYRQLHDSTSFTGKQINITFYTLNQDSLLSHPMPILPDLVVSVQSDGQETRVPISGYWPRDGISWMIPKVKPSVLCVYTPSGGNAWNANPYQVFSLIFTKKNSLALTHLGQITDAIDIDKDGTDDLIRYEDVWELGLGYLSHAGCPGAIVFLRIAGNKTVEDVVNHQDYYNAEIQKIENKIKSYSIERPAKMNDALLSLILEKFLIYRLLGKIKTGWSAFEKDIRHYDKHVFYLNNGLQTIAIPINEIKQKMVDSLKKFSK